MMSGSARSSSLVNALLTGQYSILPRAELTLARGEHQPNEARNLASHGAEIFSAAGTNGAERGSVAGPEHGGRGVAAHPKLGGPGDDQRPAHSRRHSGDTVAL